MEPDSVLFVLGYAALNTEAGSDFPCSFNFQHTPDMLSLDNFDSFIHDALFIERLYHHITIYLFPLAVQLWMLTFAI